MLFRSLKEKSPDAILIDGDQARLAAGHSTADGTVLHEDRYTTEARKAGAFLSFRLCKDYADQGRDVVICSIAMYTEVRAWNRENIENYKEVYVKVTRETLYRRDQKKLYSSGAKNVVGVDLPWDEPGHSSIVVQNDGQETPEEIVKHLFRFFGLEQKEHMTCRADLHMHSTASDGQYTPSELVKLAKEKGLEAIALTDHDNVSGVAEAEAAGQALGLRVIRGVEVSADDYLNLHILGYDFAVSVIQDWFDSLRGGRDNRKYRIRDFLRTKGLEIPLDEVDAEAVGAPIGRPHFAKVMLKHGMVATRKEAFDRYLDTPEFQAIEKGTKPSAQECVERIKAAGGKVSLAHPYQIVLGDDKLEDMLRRLIGHGLDAIECYYPQHTPEQTAEYLALAKKYSLHITGGSDFHGERNKPDNLLTAWELDLSWLI